MPSPELSIVIPVFNEEASVAPCLERLLPVLQGVTSRFEIIFVDDGGTDGTLDALLEWTDRAPVKIIQLSRNYGKEAALTAGLDAARGGAVIPMDVDLQDPPELIPRLVEKWREGYDMVLAVRESRRQDTWLKRASAEAFYRLFNRVSSTPIPFNAGDFRLMDQRVVQALRGYPERSRFMKGLFATLGFRQSSVPYERPARETGTSSWNYWKLWNFALDGLFSFTTLPLRVWSYLGVVLALFALLYAAFIIIKTLALGIDVPGYASLLVSILFFSGLQLLSIGILGEYIARIFIEAKQRPLYIVRERHGFDDPDNSSTN